MTVPVAPSENDTASVAIAPDVIAAARALVAPGQRRLLGIVGAPASGKSTLAEALVAALGDETACAVPMDGFHLAQATLDRLGRAGRKGAPDTFDAAGYCALLSRIRTAFADETVYAPGFYRSLEEPIAASIAVAPTTPLVITEGNYLLLDTPPWPAVAAALDAVWFLDVAEARREAWLAARHQRFGRSEAEAWAWIAATDRPNAERIEATAARADRELIWDGARIRFADRVDDAAL